MNSQHPLARASRSSDKSKEMIADTLARDAADSATVLPDEIFPFMTEAYEMAWEKAQALHTINS